MRATKFKRLIIPVVVLLGGCVSSPPPEAPVAPKLSQILITIDAVAPRHLAPFGGTIAMPKLAALASAGTVYDDAITTTPVSRPALVSILTGAAPDRSGVRDNIHDAVAADVPTVAEAARKAGYETAAFVSTPFASYSSGLQRGFDLFDGPEPVIIGPAQYVPPVTTAAAVSEHFKQWLASRPPGKPFFAWIHLADLNGLATPPPGSAGSSVVKSGDPLEDYDKTLAAIDDAIGAITSAAKNDRNGGNSGVLLAGTHGVFLGEQGRRGEAFWLTDETLRVPIVRVVSLADPAAAQPRHDPRPTWLPDVAASLKHEFGAAVTGDADGIALENSAPASRSRMAWTFAPDDQLAWAPLTAVKEGATLSVFETESDGEIRPVGETSASASATARARPARPRSRVVSDASRSALAAAGVTIGSRIGYADRTKMDDTWLHEMQLARRYVSMHRPLLAGRLTRRLLKETPEALPVLLTRLYILVAMPSEELSAIRDTLLKSYSDRSDALHWSAHVSLLTQDFKRASALLDAAIAVGPIEPEIYYDRACVYALQGDKKKAFDGLDTALRAGYRNWDWMDKDPDLAVLRTDPGFAALMRAHGR